MRVANFAGAMRRLVSVIRSHKMALFVVALALSVVCFQVVPGNTISFALQQSALLATFAVGAVALSGNSGGLRVRRPPAWGWIAYLLVVGFAGGMFAWWTAGHLAQVGSWANVAGIVALCLFTGVFEEGVFRVLAMRAFIPALGDGRRGVLGAAVMSSVLFGLLHASASDLIFADAIVWAQVVLKPVQAGLFGFFMAALFVRTRNFWFVSGVHTVFNLFYIGPLLLMTGTMQTTYATGSLVDLVLLATTVLLLLPLMAAALKMLRAG